MKQKTLFTVELKANSTEDLEKQIKHQLDLARTNNLDHTTNYKAKIAFSRKPTNTATGTNNKALGYTKPTPKRKPKRAVPTFGLDISKNHNGYHNLSLRGTHMGLLETTELKELSKTLNNYLHNLKKQRI